MSQDESHPEDPGRRRFDRPNIKLLYDGLIQEGLPDRFKDLLAMIRAEDKLVQDEDPEGSDE